MIRVESLRKKWLQSFRIIRVWLESGNDLRKKELNHVNDKWLTYRPVFSMLTLSWHYPAKHCKTWIWISNIMVEVAFLLSLEVKKVWIKSSLCIVKSFFTFWKLWVALRLRTAFLISCMFHTFLSFFLQVIRLIVLPLSFVESLFSVAAYRISRQDVIKIMWICSNVPQ